MEDGRGAYIFNSKDLCMIEHIPDLVDAGITSLKIEGRMKGINYLASVVKAYREAIDAYVEAPDTYSMNPDWAADLDGVFHRAYCTGFYFKAPAEQLPNYENIHQGKIHSFIGKIMAASTDQFYRINIRNKLCNGDTIEVLSPKGRPKRTMINGLLDMDRNPIDHANPNTIVVLDLGIQCQVDDIIRKI
jgi:putative protease